MEDNNDLSSPELTQDFIENLLGKGKTDDYGSHWIDVTPTVVLYIAVDSVRYGKPWVHEMQLSVGRGDSRKVYKTRIVTETESQFTQYLESLEIKIDPHGPRIVMGKECKFST